MHDHKTCGAFGALHGDRVHSVYSFKVAKEWDSDLSSGSVTRDETEVMRTGDVRPIRPELIHDLFWIDKPSVTIVVRCNEHPTSRRPMEYWANPGLAYRPIALQQNPAVKRRAQSLSLLGRASPSRYRNALAHVLKEGSPSAVYQAYLEACLTQTEVLDEVLRSFSQVDPLLELLESHRSEIRRRSILGGIYTTDRIDQLVIALYWAGCMEQEARSLLVSYASSRGEELDLEAALNSARAAARRVNPQAVSLLPDSTVNSGAE